MATDDPGFWRNAAEWLWGVLALPIIYMWKRVTVAVTKDDMREHMEEERAVHAEFRETMKTLFQNAERDRKELHDAVNALRSEMHRIHVDLIERVKR